MAKLGGVSEMEIAGGTQREDPAYKTPCKKTRGGEAAFGPTKAAATI